MDTIGITSTIPLEIPVAANRRVLDLNNIFISDPYKQRLVEYAEEQGFPHNTCCWVKGIYGAVKETGIKTIIAVTEGDCSNTHALMEVLQEDGIECIPFAYPFNRNASLLKGQIETLLQTFNVSWSDAANAKESLDVIRKKVRHIDELTWQEDKVSGWENHFFQVSCSDMAGDTVQFAQKLDNFLLEAKERPPLAQPVRLGYLGVPPIFPELYAYLESKGARVVYNEIQRQFSMPAPSDDLITQYQNYTYPYDIFTRLRDIKEQIEQRNIHGLIHYTQSFCFRQIEDIIVRKHLKTPILTLEGDAPLPLDMRTKLRLESFLESLQARRQQQKTLFAR